MTAPRGVDLELLGAVPVDAERILLVGGDGDLALRLRWRNPLAALTCLPDPDDPSLPDGAFDAIVLPEGLDGFARPQEALARLHDRLSPNGHIVLPIPNLAHWSAFYHLLHGHWPLLDPGLFERQRVRHLCLPETIDTLARAGLHVVKTRLTRHPVDEAKAGRWIPALEELCARLGLDGAAVAERAGVLRLLSLAARTEAPRPSPIHVETVTFSQVNDVRARLPTEHLASLPEVVATFHRELPDARSPPSGAAILVLHRPFTPDVSDWAARLGPWLRAGWLVVVDLDDHPDLIDRVLRRGARDSRWLPLLGAHAVQTSTPLLAEAFRRHNPEVAVFPNTAFEAPAPRVRGG